MINDWKNNKENINIKILLGKVIVLWKRYEKLLSKNYRPICLLSAIFKLLQKLILNRINYKLDDYLREMQMAFRKNKSTQKCLFLRKHMLTVEKF